MANVRNGNTWYVDTTSDSSTASTYVKQRNVKVLGFTAFVNATTDTIVISDLASSAYDASPTYAVGGKKFALDLATAKNQYREDWSNAPIVFPNGIWVTLTGSPQITFILDGNSV